MVNINFYYKDGCWFCDTALEMLNGIKERYDINVNLIDITTNDELYELYRYDIPVIEFEDGSALWGRIKKKDLIQKIQDNMK